MKRIFWYLKGTWNLKLTYGEEKRNIVGFVNADRLSQEYRRAISGYMFHGRWESSVIVIEEARIDHPLNKICLIHLGGVYISVTDM